MSKYKGLFTYDIDNHRYIPVEQADGIISDMNYTEEPKYFYCISTDGSINKYEVERYAHDSWCKNGAKIIGNYFETREEAEKAAEKLKAFKRLKDKRFRFTLTPATGSLDITPGKFQIEINAEMPEKWFCCDAVQKDLDDCFGGEE